MGSERGEGAGGSGAPAGAMARLTARPARQRARRMRRMHGGVQIDGTSVARRPADARGHATTASSDRSSARGVVVKASRARREDCFFATHGDELVRRFLGAAPRGRAFAGRRKGRRRGLAFVVLHIKKGLNAVKSRTICSPPAVYPWMCFSSFISMHAAARLMQPTAHRSHSRLTICLRYAAPGE